MRTRVCSLRLLVVGRYGARDRRACAPGCVRVSHLSLLPQIASVRKEHGAPHPHTHMHIGGWTASVRRAPLTYCCAHMGGGERKRHKGTSCQKPLRAVCRPICIVRGETSALAVRARPAQLSSDPDPGGSPRRGFDRRGFGGLTWLCALPSPSTRRKSHWPPPALDCLA